jgi:hypothetical protein
MSDQPPASVAALIAKWREWSAWEANECSNWERATTLDQCADELEALIGRLSVPQGWQPIAIAPKDDTPLLVALIEGRVIRRMSDARSRGLGFYTFSGREACYWATHWMPLPAAAVVPPQEPQS